MHSWNIPSESGWGLQFLPDLAPCISHTQQTEEGQAGGYTAETQSYTVLVWTHMNECLFFKILKKSGLGGL